MRADAWNNSERSSLFSNLKQSPNHSVLLCYLNNLPITYHDLVPFLFIYPFMFCLLHYTVVCESRTVIYFFTAPPLVGRTVPDTLIVSKYLLSERMGRIGGREGYKGRVMKRVFCFGHRKMWIYIVLQSLISFMIPWMSQRLRSLNLKQGGNIIFLLLHGGWLNEMIHAKAFNKKIDIERFPFLPL